MLSIEYKDKINKEIDYFIDMEFEKFAIKNELSLNYNDFVFIAKDDKKIVGIITGHSYYKEIYIADLIILNEYRNQHIGTRLLETVENHYKGKNYDNINLTTYNFQAPEFYKKCGYELEFIRKNKSNPKLDKYYFVKYL